MSLNGIDISAWQQGIDLTAVPADFVVIKATEGTSYVNSDCDRAYQQAKSSGKLLGVYHYANGGSVQAEADYFISNCAGYIGEAILVLDWESGDNGVFGTSSARAWVQSWCDYVSAKTGVKPMIYASKSAMDQISGLGDYGLWIAQYADDNATGYQASPWNEGAYDCAMRQYSSHGTLSGYSGYLDLNIFYGDANAWRAYAGATGTASSTAAAAVVAAPASTVPASSGYAWSVWNIQVFCNICNYGAPEMDGIEGDETRSCVKRAQAAYGITQDGLFGVVTQGYAEDQVRRYQQRLNQYGFACTVDGIAGNETLNAVKSFQASRGLVADGIVGALTFAKLFG